MNYDAINIGEQDILDPNFFKFNLPIISSNLKYSEYKFKPFIIKKLFNGIKLGIIGITDKESFEQPYIKNFKNLEITDLLDTLKSTVSTLKSQVNFIILLFHGKSGVEDIIANNIKDINLIVSSHDARVYNPNLHKVNETILLTTPMQGKKIGKIEITLNNNKIVNYNNTLIELDKNIPDDLTINKIINLE